MAEVIQTPEHGDPAYEAFMGTCMQEKLATMPDMGERRKACQAEWDAAHPAAVRPGGLSLSTTTAEP